jgi:hypothetical protein
MVTFLLIVLMKVGNSKVNVFIASTFYRLCRILIIHVDYEWEVDDVEGEIIPTG